MTLSIEKRADESPLVGPCSLLSSPLVDLSRSSTRFSLTTDLPARNSGWPIASRLTDPLLLPRRTWTCEWNNFGEPFPTFADPIHCVKIFYARFDERFSRTRSILLLGRNFFVRLFRKIFRSRKIGRLAAGRDVRRSRASFSFEFPSRGRNFTSVAISFAG